MDIDLMAKCVQKEERQSTGNLCGKLNAVKLSTDESSTSKERRSKKNHKGLVEWYKSKMEAKRFT